MTITLYTFANQGNPAVTPPPGPAATGAQLDFNFAQAALVDLSNLSSAGLAVIGAGGLAGGAVLSFATRTAAAAATIASTVSAIITFGFATINDKGGATYQRVTSTAGRGGFFTSADGAMWALSEQRMVAAMFGMFPNGADVAPICAQVALELTFRAANGGTPWFELAANSSYTIYTTAPASQTKLFDLSAGCSGLRFFGNGSQFVCPSDLLTGEVIIYGLLLRLSTDVIIRIGYQQTIATNSPAIVSAQPGTELGGPNFNGGIWGVFIQDRVVGSDIQVVMNGGLGGLVFARSGGPLIGDQRGRDCIYKVDAINVFYPFNCRNNGDNLVGVVNSSNAGRTWFCYNCFSHRATVNSIDHSQAFDDVVIKCYANSTSSPDSVTANFDILYNRSNTNNLAGDDSSVYVAFDQQQVAYAVGQFRNIRVTLNGDYQNVAGAARVWVISKASTPNGNVNDNTAVAHEIDGLVFSGAVSNLNNVVFNPHLADIFSLENWTGALVKNSGFHNFTCRNSSGDLPILFLDGRGMQDNFPFIFRDFATDGTMSLTNFIYGGGLVLDDFYSTDLPPQQVVTTVGAYTVPVGVQFIYDTAVMTASNTATLPTSGVSRLTYIRTGSDGFSRTVGGTALANNTWAIAERFFGQTTWTVVQTGAV